MTLYQYLIEKKSYTEAEAEETVLRFENNMIIPDEVKKDIKSYYKDTYGKLRIKR